MHRRPARSAAAPGRTSGALETDGAGPRSHLARSLAGQGLANPVAMILSAVLMLQHIGKPSDADRLERAVAAVLAEGKHRTGDLHPEGEPARTKDVAEAICSQL